MSKSEHRWVLLYGKTEDWISNDTDKDIIGKHTSGGVKVRKNRKTAGKFIIYSSNFYFTCLPLYMFRALLASIIRSI